ncbi:MAG: hypothetical protein IKH11_01650 [Bacteroidales bacterium]|nr:hypothetical protein [Bacteroidales bacterium]
MKKKAVDATVFREYRTPEIELAVMSAWATLCEASGNLPQVQEEDPGFSEWGF